MAFFDTHCHIGFTADSLALVRDACASGSSLAWVSVTPQEFEGFQPLEDRYQAKQIYRGLGLHPWWVPSSSQELTSLLDQFDALLAYADFFGEVGLDFSKRWAAAAPQQMKALSHVIKRCCNHPLPVSLHCVRAYNEVLSLLSKTSCASHAPVIFHWFSGSSDQLQQAIALGCWFSINPRMLNAKRGRAYVQAIPRDRLLLETDAPEVPWDFTQGSPQNQTWPQVDYSYERQAAILQKTCNEVARLCHIDTLAAEALFMTNAKQVFSRASQAHNLCS